MSDNYIDSADSGSNYSFGDKRLPANAPRSLFDLSHLNSLTINNAGSLIPVCLIETVPNDSFEISESCLLRVLPQVVPLYSRQRLYFYAFYARSCDLWKQAHAYYKRGYDGNFYGNKPKLTEANMADGYWTRKIQSEDLLDYLGLPIGFSPKELNDVGAINALPVFMYEKIYQGYFMEKNLFIHNRAWLPDDEADLRLNGDEVISNSYLEAEQSGIKLGQIHYRNYPKDYFTSCVPTPTRGSTPNLDFSFTGQNPIIKAGLGDPNYSGNLPYNYTKGDVLSYSPITSPTDPLPVSSFNVPGQLTAQAGFRGLYTHLYADLSSVNLSSTITLDKLRQLSIATEEVERMARTDGSYIDFGLTFFDVVCKNALDYRPILFGASYQSISFSEVLQTTPTSGAPLGAYGGHGISVPSENGYLGKIDCDDYGYIMIVASIMPDVYYHQGLDKLWTKTLQKEEFLPNRAKMGLIPVLNKELYFSGNKETDDDLFAYQNPFEEMRYKASTIHGKIADASNLSFFPYTQSRHFGETPTYSPEFFTADDVRKDYLAGGTAESAYTCQIKFDIRAVRPLSYVGIPAQIV